MSLKFLLVVSLGVLLLTTCSLADHDHHKPPRKPSPLEAENSFELDGKPPKCKPPKGPRPPPKHRPPTPLDNEAASGGSRIQKSGRRNLP
ncbi:unnamed protein product [Prunus armeniaca]|uniref:Proline-rich protein n=1 Tax=Prunus armeniaca TaxID=36596 RepID=A0A6J5VXM4_PRUAR|nr:unnamed protein product [Prunus armeniaca]